MTYLLDTCVLSELTKPKPNPGLVQWLATVPESNLFVSVLTLGELHQGIVLLPEGKKKESIQQWFDFELIPRFAGNILALTEKEALYWGKLAGLSRRKGQPLPVIDSLLAATAAANALTIVTNDEALARAGAEALNPWR